MTLLNETARLMWLVLRRDRWILPLWILFAAVVPVAIAKGYDAMSVAERLQFARETSGNTAEIAITGPVYDTSIGGLTAWRVRGWSVLGLAMASLLMISRHTRKDEETGRRELIASTPIGRLAPLISAVLVASLAHLAVAALLGGFLTASGQPAPGAFTLGLSAAASGWLFVGVAAVAVQLSDTGRGVISVGALILAVLYGGRAIADSGAAPWLAWIDPISWIQQMRPFAMNGNQLWPLLTIMAVVAVLLFLGVFVEARRDLGESLLPARDIGPIGANRHLRNSFALAWRIQRGMLIGWSAGFTLFGLALGGVAVTAAQQIDTTKSLQAMVSRLGSGQQVDGFLALIIYLLSQVVAAYAILAVLRARTQESEGLSELLLSTKASRIQMAGSHFAIAVIGSGVALAGLGAGIGLVYRGSTGQSVVSEVLRMVLATLAHLPAVVVIAGIALALFGLVPRAAAIVSWLLLGFFLILELDSVREVAGTGITDLSPFVHAPSLPVGQLTAEPIIGLLLTAAVLAAAGLIGFRRRDIVT